MEPTPTYDQVIAERRLSPADLVTEFARLKAYKPRTSSRCFAGNPILYHYQLDNLCRVKTGKGSKTQSFHDMMSDDTQREEWWVKINKYAHGSRPDTPATRLFEIYRRCSGAVVFFKPTIALNLYAHCKATHVLDPTAGWGGRILAAMASGIAYTGIDTNVDLVPSINAMVADLKPPDTPPTVMIWQDALTVDFSTIDYDCVLTSPPYINLELYAHMPPFESKKAYYTNFLIPLITKCRDHIKRNGKVCFNISPVMYRELIAAGYEECAEKLPMLQQKVRGKDKEDMVYVWDAKNESAATKN
jgi:hypothetical protein